MAIKQDECYQEDSNNLKSNEAQLNLMTEDIKIERPKWTFLLIMTGFFCTIGSSMPVGYNIGVMNNPQLIIREFCNESIIARYGFVPDEIQLNLIWSSIVSIFLIGGMIGSLSGGMVADKWGRKGTLLVNYVLCIIASILFLISPTLSSIECLLFARFFVGIAGGMTTAILPMYLTEVAPLELRGALGTLCPMGITTGLVLAQILGLNYILGTPSTWHYLLALFGLLIIISCFSLPFLPESPKYLFIVRNEHEKAAKELSRLRGVPIALLQEELESLKVANLSEQTTDKWSIKKLLTTPELKWPLILTCALQAGQQLNGINAVFYYSVPIFISAGLDELGSQYASIGAGFVNCFVSILAMWLAHRFRRRLMVFSSIITTIICLSLLGVAIGTMDTISWMPYVSIAMLLTYVFCYGIGLGPVPYFIGAELFTVGPRPTAMALGSMANWTGNFIVGMTFPTIQSILGAFSFVPFIILTILLGILLWFRLPETYGIEPVDPLQQTNESSIQDK